MAVAAEVQFHVLAVDDSLIDRKLIERLLRTSSYQVTAVDSGSKALELLGLHGDDSSSSSHSGSPSNHEIGVNLVITDYCMPGMTGYDLLKKIKETSSLKDIPVVIMSSENVPGRISRCLEEGADEFFLKPVQLSDMEKLIPHMMRGKSKEQQKHQFQQEETSSQLQQFDRPDNSKMSSSHNNSNDKSNNNNKRRTMDEDLQPQRSLSPERTRARYTVIA